MKTLEQQMETIGMLRSDLLKAMKAKNLLVIMQVHTARDSFTQIEADIKCSLEALDTALRYLSDDVAAKVCYDRVPQLSTYVTTAVEAILLIDSYKSRD